MPIEPAKPFTTNASTVVRVIGAIEPWTQYALADGTTIRARLRVQEFRRFDGQWDVNGNPVYSHGHLIDFVVDNVSPELRQP
jgi:hypothetical protein